MKLNTNVAIFRTSPEIRKVCCKLIKSWKKTGSFIPGYCTHPGNSVGSVCSGGPEVAGSISGHIKIVKNDTSCISLATPDLWNSHLKNRPCGTGTSGDTVMLKYRVFTSSSPPQSVLILDFNWRIFFFNIYLSGFEQDFLQDCNSGNYLIWVLFPEVGLHA